jgi:hypothetical protein
MEADCIFFTPNRYDDGNQVYEQYENKWFMFGSCRGKCALVNGDKSDIKINSISLWKIIKIHYALI